jgi:hypothetical protein
MGQVPFTAGMTGPAPVVVIAPLLLDAPLLLPSSLVALLALMPLPASLDEPPLPPPKPDAEPELPGLPPELDSVSPSSLSPDPSFESCEPDEPPFVFVAPLGGSFRVPTGEEPPAHPATVDAATQRRSLRRLVAIQLPSERGDRGHVDPSDDIGCTTSRGQEHGAR